MFRLASHCRPPHTKKRIVRFFLSFFCATFASKKSKQTMDTAPNSNTRNAGRRLTIRASRHSLSFSAPDTAQEACGVTFEPYTVRSGIAIAANLREAFKTATLPGKGYGKALLMVDSPVLMMPVDLFREQDADTLYRHSFPRQTADRVEYNVLPELNAVALFSVNKDLRLVVDDHFADVKVGCAMSPVWKYLHQRSFIGPRSKLYGYFHDRKLDIFCFAQNRFKYCNAFETTHAHDALYFLLYVWKQLAMKPEHDEMHIVGDIPEQAWILAELRKYLLRAYVINPSADFNRAPASLINGMPYDLMAYYVKGR